MLSETQIRLIFRVLLFLVWNATARELSKIAGVEYHGVDCVMLLGDLKAQSEGK